MNGFPSWSQLWRVLTLADFNTRVVVVGVAILGMAAGIVGTFMLLRKRSLVSDAIGHATLPGVAVAWLVMVALGGTGKWLPGLLIGAAAGGLLAIVVILVLRSVGRLHEDVALGVVLSVSFGVGVALIGVIQQMRNGSAAGIGTFIHGKTASMLTADAVLIGVISLLIVVATVTLFKELNILCFDSQFAACQGLPVGVLDVVMMALVVAVTVIGLQAVGLILIVALLITPAAAARFWTHNLRKMTILAAAIGGLGGFVGAGVSALVPRMPAGAVIVVATSVEFLLSVLFGTHRGMVRSLLERRRVSWRVARQNLMRSLYEIVEDALGASPSLDQLSRVTSRDDLEQRRAWRPRHLTRALRAATRDLLIAGPARAGVGGFRLTESGAVAAREIVRNHRLWELYLIEHADVATSRVDRGADQVEHVLEPRLIAELEELLKGPDGKQEQVAPSPHLLEARDGDP